MESCCASSTRSSWDCPAPGDSTSLPVSLTAAPFVNLEGHEHFNTLEPDYMRDNAPPNHAIILALPFLLHENGLETFV